jgi:hypothetical protein
MIALLLLLKIVHIGAAAIWIGGSLTAPSDIQRTLGLGPPHTGALMPRLRKISSIMNQSALATFLTGVALMAVIGFAQTPHRIWLSIVLTLLAVAAGRWMIRPVLGEIGQALKNPPVPPEEIARIMIRFRMVNGVEHALRAAVLVLMVYPFRF